MYSNMSDLNQFVLLMCVFNLKHHIADFPLQTDEMVQGKGLKGRDFFWPLVKHSLVHQASTLIIILIVDYKLWWLSVFDFVVHFSMDRLKASPNLMAKTKDWRMTKFAIDQHFHKLTDVAICYVLVTNKYTVPMLSVVVLLLMHFIGSFFYNQAKS